MTDNLSDIQASLGAKDGHYDPSEVMLIGTHMEPGGVQHEGKIKVTAELLSAMTLSCEPEFAVERKGKKAEFKETDPTLAVIYAYSYEGHTYRLAKPRIMVVSGNGAAYEDGSSKGGLTTWCLSKHTRTVSVEVESGSVESLVLDGNQPGNRSATSYHSHMQLSHRGGRLT